MPENLHMHTFATKLDFFTGNGDIEETEIPKI